MPTANRLFAAPIDHMGPGGNGYNTIIMDGTYQNNEGKPVYNMSTDKVWTFYFDSPVLNKVEITGAQMNTVNAGSPTTNASVIANGAVDANWSIRVEVSPDLIDAGTLR